MAEALSKQEISRQFEAYSKRYNQLSVRERVLLMLVSVFVIYMLFSLLWLSPLFEKQRLLQEESVAVVSDLKNKTRELSLLSMQLGAAGKKNKEKQLAELNEQLLQLNKELNLMTSALVEADRLPVLLEEVLNSTGQLQLIKLQTQTVEKIHLEGEPLVDGEPDSEGGVYKHPVELILRGSYRSLLVYLQSLEKLDWRFYWESLDYQVDGYPKGDIRLRVYTLTTDEGWLSVE